MFDRDFILKNDAKKKGKKVSISGEGEGIDGNGKKIEIRQK